MGIKIHNRNQRDIERMLFTQDEQVNYDDIVRTTTEDTQVGSTSIQKPETRASN